MKNIFNLSIYWDKGIFGQLWIFNFLIWFEREFTDYISVGIQFGRKRFEKAYKSRKSIALILREMIDKKESEE